MYVNMLHLYHMIVQTTPAATTKLTGTYQVTFVVGVQGSLAAKNAYYSDYMDKFPRFL